MFAVVWKEWRENRLGLLVFVLAGVMIQACLGRDPKHPELPVTLTLLLFIPTYVAMVGASTIAPEVGERTLGFLLSRPIGRWKIWLAKTLSALLLAVMATVALGCLSVLLTPGSWSRATVALGDLSLEHVCSLILLLFSTSVFSSTLFDRTMPAFLSAVLLAGAFVAGLGMTDMEILFVPLVLVGTAAFLAISLVTFCRSELLIGPRKLVCATLGVVALVVLLCLGVPSFAWLVRTVPVGPGSAIESVNLTRVGSLLYAVEDTALGQWRQSMWLLEPRTGAIRKLPAPQLEPQAMLPDGSGFIALDGSNCVGLPSMKGTALVLASLDGRVTRLGEREFNLAVRRVSFSADGTRAVLLTSRYFRGRFENEILLVDIRGRTCESLFTADSNTIEECDWSADGRSVRFLRSTGGRPDRNLWQIDVSGGGRTHALSSSPLPTSAAAAQPADLLGARWQLVPHRDALLAWSPPAPGRRGVCHLVDLRSGTVRWSVETDLGERAHVSSDGRWLAGACGRSPDGVWSLAWEVIDMDLGRTVARIDQADRGVSMSADGHHAAYSMPSADESLAPDRRRGHVGFLDVTTGRTVTSGPTSTGLSAPLWVDASHVIVWSRSGGTIEAVATDGTVTPLVVAGR